jgi:leucyl aminopeptidase
MTPEMKTDKSGGCVVVAVIKYFTQQQVTRFNIVGILPVVENILSENVTRPGDIIKSYQGKTVEVTDTDAEGRLIMADAIAYSKHYNPAYILDVATLTGWADTVHMDLASVCYSRNKELVEKITKIGDKVGERVWFLPVWDEYTEYIKSNVANVKNYNPNVREGAYYPSMFLLSFVPIELRDKYIHFDVCNNFEKNLARGNCVSLLIETMDALGKK